jgi:hypothetical protein
LVPRGAAAVRVSKAAAATATTWWGGEAAAVWSGVGACESAGGACGACGRVKRGWRKEALRVYLATSFSFILTLDRIEARSRNWNRLDPLLIDWAQCCYSLTVHLTFNLKLGGIAQNALSNGSKKYSKYPYRQHSASLLIWILYSPHRRNLVDTAPSLQSYGQLT